LGIDWLVGWLVGWLVDVVWFGLVASSTRRVHPRAKLVSTGKSVDFIDCFVWLAVVIKMLTYKPPVNHTTNHQSPITNQLPVKPTNLEAKRLASSKAQIDATQLPIRPQISCALL
jgi:hypothetical protein